MFEDVVRQAYFRRRRERVLQTVEWWGRRDGKDRNRRDVEIDLRQAGGSVSATPPKDIADRLNVRAGDRVYVAETEQGVLLTPYGPSFDEAMQALDEVRRDYRNTLRKLADWAVGGHGAWARC